MNVKQFRSAAAELFTFLRYAYVLDRHYFWFLVFL